MSRETTIQVRVSHEEKARIVKNAEDFGVSPSDYLRSQALFARPDAPVRCETAQDKANKAKVRKAVENEESYEVKIEPGTTQSDREPWIEGTARILMMEKGLSKVAATIQATKEWEAANG